MIQIKKDHADIVSVFATDGRTLLRIRHDGEVEGALDDMGEAARVFMTEIRDIIDGFGFRPHRVVAGDIEVYRVRGGFVAARDGSWLPGVYDTSDAAIDAAQVGGA